MSRRAWLGVHLYLAVQVALPLRWYLGLADRTDERFSWRMFSPERMVACQPRLTLADGSLVSLTHGVHPAWATLTRRGRPAVIEALAHRACSRAGTVPPVANGGPARLTASCLALDGATFVALDEPFDCAGRP